MKGCRGQLKRNNYDSSAQLSAIHVDDFNSTSQPIPRASLDLQRNPKLLKFMPVQRRGKHKKF